MWMKCRRTDGILWLRQAQARSDLARLLLYCTTVHTVDEATRYRTNLPQDSYIVIRIAGFGDLLQGQGCGLFRTSTKDSTYFVQYYTSYSKGCRTVRPHANQGPGSRESSRRRIMPNTRSHRHVDPSARGRFSAGAPRCSTKDTKDWRRV
jgi:hypothetical protein